MGRKFVRISLGGVRDEAEIRGHRRTYIGALPGKIIQSLKKAGSGNPVFLLDEVDKMSTDFRGDPSAALLEVLDPEQNFSFNDHYLDLDYDLSKVMFICTANTMSGIPRPLQDRMEIIRIAGYTESRSSRSRGGTWSRSSSRRTASTACRCDFRGRRDPHLVHRYTKESGVRSLEREIASVCRKIAKDVLEGRATSDGRVPRRPEDRAAATSGRRASATATAEAEDQLGLTTGLAWTELGGELLTIEAHGACPARASSPSPASSAR